ncbi:chaperone protein dnaJ 11 [Forsythia ovata]|uniref:Chaperone protein dnaJ 11 n=1 Tax=Forsythia ovata TaxID=205694 RepID=A0ABD1UB24_9LAMI
MTATLPLRSPTSFYEVLGIPMGASSQEIKAAYRKLARICHPDVAPVDKKDTSADEFMRIHTAYSTLSDAEKRADYDLRIFRLHRISGSYSVEYVSTSRREIRTIEWVGEGINAADSSGDVDGEQGLMMVLTKGGARIRLRIGLGEE